MVNKDGFKVAEIFGPTLQGEGPSAGLPVCFVRFGGCDYRCKWCDSLHAVLPEEVKILPTLSTEEIVRKLEALIGDKRGFRRVVFSGGNPLLWDLSELVIALKAKGWWISVETQGTIHRDWVNKVNEIVLSPKPPSSNMNQSYRTIENFRKKLSFQPIMGPQRRVHLKIVIFTHDDLEYAYQLALAVGAQEMYLSVGTDPTDSNENLFAKMERIWDWIQTDFHHFSIRTYLSPQMHVLLWGHKLGV